VPQEGGGAPPARDEQPQAEASAESAEAPPPEAPKETGPVTTAGAALRQAEAGHDAGKSPTNELRSKAKQRR
jgi:hypothetical protein